MASLRAGRTSELTGGSLSSKNSSAPKRQSSRTGGVSGFPEPAKIRVCSSTKEPSQAARFTSCRLKGGIGDCAQFCRFGTKYYRLIVLVDIWSSSFQKLLVLELCANDYSNEGIGNSPTAELIKDCERPLYPQPLEIRTRHSVIESRSSLAKNGIATA